MFAFEQCLLCLGHHADFWYEAAQFLEQSSAVLTEKGVSSEKEMRDNNPLFPSIPFTISRVDSFSGRQRR